ncbi:PREDICTED: vacuolar protein sorting-associated protein 16 homolog, partial [Priapulus caudatus]|uniref:Vacuolar protein sorting-associated protein 16 homolog n=1 Tax=Priapulus caudatus TaxID=37621 RepID=A0ABM1EV85_PRICU
MTLCMLEQERQHKMAEELRKELQRCPTDVVAAVRGGGAIQEHVQANEQDIRAVAAENKVQVQQTDIDDEQVALAIAEKLGNTAGISYSEIASKASECGRTQLAIRLLDHEPRASEQVPLLMKVNRDDLALTKAIDSGDTDLGEPPGGAGEGRPRAGGAC